jgi:hypothetical protein
LVISEPMATSALTYRKNTRRHSGIAVAAAARALRAKCFLTRI